MPLLLGNGASTLCLPGRIEEEDDTMDYGETPTQNITLDRKISISGKLRTDGSSPPSSPRTPPNALKLPMRSSEPIRYVPSAS